MMGNPKKRFCLRGHDTDVVGRLDRQCRECKRVDARDWKRRNRDHVRAYMARYGADPANKVRACELARTPKRRSKVLDWQRKQRAENTDYAERRRAQIRRWSLRTGYLRRLNRDTDSALAGFDAVFEEKYGNL